MLIPRIWTSSTIYIFTGSIITDLICWLQKCDSQFNKDIIFISFSCETNTVVWGSTELPTCGCRFDLNHQCACEEVRGGYRVVVESRCPECEGAPFKGGTWYSLGSVWVNRNCYQINKVLLLKMMTVPIHWARATTPGRVCGNIIMRCSLVRSLLRALLRHLVRAISSRVGSSGHLFDP
jgi:hypothetical protein